MPYKNNDELPKGVKDHLPAHAQNIYREAFNNAFSEYKDISKRRGPAPHEVVAHKVAWAAVKKVYKKGEDGNWVEKE